MTASTISWFWTATLLLTLLIPAAWVLSRVMRRLAGARAAYACWLLPLVALVPPGSLSLSSVVALPTWVAVATPATGGATTAVAFNVAWGMALWLAGATLFLAALAYRQLRFQRWLRDGGTGHAVDRPEPVKRLVPRALPVRLYTRCPTPMLVGFLPPRLCLPADFESRPRAAQEMVLHHELAHLRHGDPWWNVLGVLFRVLFWFHPLVHLAWFRFRGDQELAADEAVLNTLDRVERVDYARLLCSTAGLRLPSIGLGGFLVSSLKERVVMIDQANAKRLPATAGLMVALLLAVSTGFVVAATGSDGGNAEFDREQYLPVDRVNPKWPRSALVQGTTGWVRLEGTVDREGRILEARVLEASPEGVFEETSLNAFKQWRFPERPATHAETVTVRQTINYRLDMD